MKTITNLPPMDLFLKSLQTKSPQLLLDEIHSIFLDLGFIRYNPVAGTATSNPPEWQDSTLSFFYTLPSLLASDQTHKPPSTVQVKIQPLGNFHVIYGSLAGTICSNSPWKLCVDTKLSLASLIRRGEASGFRVRVKDGLCFPLLIDIAEAAGIPGPNCFSTLPPELKLGIMARLPAKAVARMECVCREMRSLSNGSEKLWLGKYVEKYGEVVGKTAPPSSSLSGKDWKRRFVRRAGKRVLPATEEGGEEAKRQRVNGRLVVHPELAEVVRRWRRIYGVAGAGNLAAN